jgi:transposase
MKGDIMIFANVNYDRLNLLEKELKDAKNVKWYKRLMIIQLSSQGKTVKQLAKDFNICQASIRDYIKRYNTGDLQNLRRQNSNGRPHKIKLTKTQWEELLHQSPCQFEKLNTGARNWTQKLLVDYCSQYLDAKMSQSSISMLMKRLGIRWNRGKLKVTSPDPLYILKRERVEELKKSQVRYIE